jgi:LysR family transcriptional regulator for bpeEF and oprC
VPSSPEALREHALVMFSGGTQRRGWRLLPEDAAEAQAVRIDGPARLRVNNSFAVRDALLKSLGIGQLPLLIAAEPLAAGRLVPVLPGWRLPSMPVHAVYPSQRYLSPKVRAFIDLALERFPHDNEEARAVVAEACRAAAPAPSARKRARPARA